jgi:hypothetical protein
MNERIEKISEQARQYADSMYPSGLDIAKWGPAYQEKFAELIVKECIELCETAAYAPRPALNPTPVEQYAFIIGEGNMAVNLAKQIRKHFGVEE